MELKITDSNLKDIPNEAFTEIQMQEQWFKYAHRAGEKGLKILESLLLLKDPILKGASIIHELPNESSRINFEAEKHDLLGYLRGKLHNYSIDIEIVINESIVVKKAFSTQEKYNHFKEINPNIELLRKSFDLDF